jgi:hypothetical protein
MSLYGIKDKEAAYKAMLEWVDDDVIPVAYGGKNVLPLSECSLEVALAQYVAKLNENLPIEEGDEEEESKGDGSSIDDDGAASVSPSSSSKSQ